MPNLKEVRSRIESVRSTQQITSAMKMVSASKLRRAQNAILNMRPYAAKLNELMQHISSSLGSETSSPYTEVRKPEKILIVAISSNRGLCGPFNANVGKMVIQRVRGVYAAQYKAGKVDVFTIGKKVHDFLRVRRIGVSRRNDDLLDNLTFETAVPMAEYLMEEFRTGQYDRVEIIYNQFKNAAVQILKTVQFLPVAPPRETRIAKTRPEQVDYIFEPSKEEIVEKLIPKSLKIRFYSALLDSAASEHGARMTAMHKATENAQELLKDLRLKYNKARQAAITNEIIEIVSGAEALNG
ncbi:MAG: ATP synthase F1 subunit gamma [Bacteroidales bacterium]